VHRQVAAMAAKSIETQRAGMPRLVQSVP
jgi:hypothetical protein